MTKIHARASIQSSASCSPNFQFLFNSKSVSPCHLAAAVSAPCFQGSYNVGPLQPNTHYDPPSKSRNTVNRCTCSWAAYNLLSACVACQDQESSISPWAAYRTDCDGDNISETTYWPSDILISGNQTLPFYAGTNPNTWKDQTFNVQRARNMSLEDHPELTGAAVVPTSTPSNAKGSSLPIGAIVGGAVGGVVLLASAALTYWILCRRKSSRGVQELRRFHRDSLLSETTHVPGDISVKYTPVPLHPQPGTSIYGTATSEGSQTFRPVSSQPGSPTLHGHVYPHTVRQSTIAGSPPHDMRLYPPENNIQPFLLSSPRAQSPGSDGDRSGIANSPPRKGTVSFNPYDPYLGVNRPQEYDDSDAQMDYFSGNFRTGRNPPAYTYYPEASGSSGNRESSSLLFSGSSDYQARSTSGQFSPSVISDDSPNVGRTHVQARRYSNTSPPMPMSRRTSAMVSVGHHAHRGGLDSDVEIA